MPNTNLTFEVDSKTANDYLTFHFAKQHGLLLGQLHEQTADIIHRPNCDIMGLFELQRQLPQHKFILHEINAERFQQLLTQVFTGDTHQAAAIASDVAEDLDLDQLADNLAHNADLLASDDDAPIIRLLNAVLIQAIKRPASDIHFESFADTMVVRFRVDGVLHKILDLDRNVAPLMISRIKVMARLDIAEKRLPQDGRMTLNLAGHQIDVRVSTLPASYGERIVLRLLDKQQARLDLKALGMPQAALTQFKHLIHQPNGIILVTGPTGSGKTTSLYAALTELNQSERNILTVEDPIEYDLQGIGQTAVNYKVDMSFARGLRAILRQDPDVVMVGEIRDQETAEIAVQASLTGHLVLSTLHTNTAVGAITRLQDMGIEPFLLASSLIGIMAQRLIRLLCPNCKQAIRPDANAGSAFRENLPQQIFEPTGCSACQYTGFKGRSGIYELISLNENIQHMIYNGKNQQQLLKAIREHSNSMLDDGLDRVRQGDTSLAEVMRVVGE